LLHLCKLIRPSFFKTKLILQTSINLVIFGGNGDYRKEKHTPVY